MNRNKFDKKFIEFPLICLSYIQNDRNRLKDILRMCIVDIALKSTLNTDIDYGQVQAKDFDFDNPIHKEITAIANNYNVVLDSYEKATNNWLDLKTISINYEKSFGKDAYCRMGKELTIDAINGNFSLREYLCLAAIQSILGKRKRFLRITYEQIAYRMLGYKSKLIAHELGYADILSPIQIRKSVMKLMKKRLIVCVTYMFREKYYSTKIKSAKALREVISESKIKNARLRSGIDDYEWSLNTQKEIKHLRIDRTKLNYPTG